MSNYKKFALTFSFILTASSLVATGNTTWRVLDELYSGIDVGRGSHVAMCDIDADGDLDLFIGEEYGKICYYRNDGTADSADFTFVSSNYAGIDTGWWTRLDFVDIDNDNDYDMYISHNDNTHIYFYRNDGDSANASFVNAGTIPVSNHDQTPRLADIDNDGDYDLFIGCGHWSTWTEPLQGQIVFYRNDGAVSSPSWTFVTDFYQGIDTYNFSNLTFGDIDGDGDLDLLIGEDQARMIFFYRNDGTPENAVFNLVSDDYCCIDRFLKTDRTSPYLVDINNDSCLELLVGELAGTINYVYMDTTKNFYVSTAGNDSTGTGIEANPFRTIEHALTKSFFGDSIIVKPGIYDVAGGESFPFSMRHGVGFIGEKGADSTILDAGGTNRVILSDGIKANPVISGFTIKNGSSTYGGGVYIRNSEPVVTGNRIFSNNVSVRGGGIHIQQQCNPVITGNEISSNNASDDGGGICVMDTCSPIIRENIIAYNNSGDAGAGIYSVNKSDPLIIQNIITGNISNWHCGAGVYVSTSGRAHIDSNTITDNKSGIGSWSTSDTVFASWNNIYFNTYQPADSEVFTETSISCPMENNFWGISDSAGISAVVCGAVNFMPFCATRIPGVAGEPLTVDSVRNYAPDFSTVLDTIWGNPDTLRLRIYGTDRLSNIREAAVAIIKSGIYESGIAVALIETGINSGIYEGRVLIKGSTGNDSIRTDDIRQTIKVDTTGDFMTIITNVDTTKEFTVYYRIATACEEGKPAGRFELLSPAPNPSQKGVVIKYGLARKSDINLALYDVSGRLVKTLCSGVQEKGYHAVNIREDEFARGIYFIKMRAGEYKGTRKLVLMR